MGRTRHVAIIALLATVALAGCADEASPNTGTDGPAVEATGTTGGIRGVVVDQGIVPIKDATVKVLNTELSTATNEDGEFVFSGLDPGSYFIEATHPLYDKQQTSNEVVAGVKNPPVLKIQLTRLITDAPFSETLQMVGFIVCSTNLDGVGYSEECGEGVGIPCDSPVMPCERVGRQEGSKPQLWFRTTQNDPKSIIIEQVWDPSVNVATGNTEEFYTRVAIDWFCDPFCGGDTIAATRSASPLYLRADAEALDTRQITPETDLSTFVYSGASNGVIIEQDYEQYVTIAYGIEFPEGWSFVNQDERPF